MRWFNWNWIEECTSEAFGGNIWTRDKERREEWVPLAECQNTRHKHLLSHWFQRTSFNLSDQSESVLQTVFRVLSLILLFISRAFIQLAERRFVLVRQQTGKTNCRLRFLAFEKEWKRDWNGREKFKKCFWYENPSKMA